MSAKIINKLWWKWHEITHSRAFWLWVMPVLIGTIGSAMFDHWTGYVYDAMDWQFLVFALVAMVPLGIACGTIGRHYEAGQERRPPRTPST